MSKLPPTKCNAISLKIFKHVYFLQLVDYAAFVRSYLLLMNASGQH